MITDANTDKGSEFVKRILTFGPRDVVSGETATELYRFKPGYPFQIEDVQVYVTALTATATVEVKVGNDTDGFTTVLTGAITPVAATVVEGTLVSAITSRRGADDDEVLIEVTTDGTGDFTDLSVTVALRKNPLAGESSFGT